MTLSPEIEIRLVAPHELAEPLSFLEETLRNSEPVPSLFVEQLERAVEKGYLEVLAAWREEQLIGVAVLAFRPSFSAGAPFASIEDLYVKPEARRRGVGRKLLEAVGERCRARGVSYVEVQTDDEAAAFYSVLGYEPQPGAGALLFLCFLAVSFQLLFW